jgi:putative FmdB family regulatory protein
MPTYQYACSKCGHEFEVFQSMKDAALEICPEDKCGRKRWGKGKIQRQLGTGAGLIFKGSGFYITDYRSDSYKAAAKKDAGGSSTSSSSSSSSSGSSSSGSSSSSSSSGKSEGGSSKSTPSTGSSSKPKPSAT